MLQTKSIDNSIILYGDDDDDGAKVTIVVEVGCALLETITILVRFIILLYIASVFVLRNVDIMFNT
jgi:hypothetical protein